MVQLIVSSQSVHYSSPTEGADRRRQVPTAEGSTSDAAVGSANPRTREPFEDDRAASSDAAVAGRVVGRSRQRVLTIVPGGVSISDPYDSYVLSEYSPKNAVGLAVVFAIGVGLYFMIVQYTGRTIAITMPLLGLALALFLGWLSRGETLVFDHRNGCAWIVSRRMTMHCCSPSRKHRTAYGALVPPVVGRHPDDDSPAVLLFSLSGGDVTLPLCDVGSKSQDQRNALIDTWRVYLGELAVLADDVGPRPDDGAGGVVRGTVVV